jgi:hypothetical protein
MFLIGEWVVAGLGFGLVMLGALTAVTILGIVVVRGDRRNRASEQRDRGRGGGSEGR